MTVLRVFIVIVYFLLLCIFHYIETEIIENIVHEAE